jgi:uracil-DNA glycosylase family 4
MEQILLPSFSNCEGCKGCVFPRVKREAPPQDIEIMVIGDIPTAIEGKRGEYLKGPAADILKKTMTKVGLPVDEKRVHFTTAVKCAFPKRKGKQVPNEIMRNCHRHIVEEIKAVNPRMVLVLGKTAIQTVYGDTSIKVQSVMGRVTPIPGVSEEIIVVPVLHPALIMRSPGEYKPFLVSMQLVATLFKGGKAYDTGEVGYQVLDTEDKCDRAITMLSALPVMRVSADMETTGLDYRIAEFLVLGIGFAKNKVFVIPRPMRHRVKDFFAIKHLKWVWQHGKYDTKVMWRRKIGTVPLDADVMYMHYILDETSAHDLEYLSKVFLQAEAYKYKMNQNFKAISLENYESWFEALCERVAVDCDYTYQLHDVILAEVDKEPGLKKAYSQVVMPMAPFLSRVEQNGILLDPELLEEYGANYVVQLEGIMKEIEDLAAPFWDRETYMMEMDAKSAPDKFNPGSSKQMQWMVHKKLKLKPRRKKGLSTGADILESIDPPHPLVDKVLEYRSVKKEYSTYVIGLLKWRDVDGRVRTNFNIQVTATGRLSSKEPNVQNLPNAFGVGNIRRAIIPPKGYIVMDSDYSGAELRWLACLSKCPVLLDIFRTGKNLHNETAKAIWGKDYTPQHKMRAKAVNFGIPYGREAQSFVDEFNISKKEAQEMIDGWLNKYYGARDFLLYCADSVTKGYYLETPFGRRRRFGLVTPDSLHNLQNEARNFPIQSSSSDTTCWAAMELEETARQYKSQIINLVHDSILFYTPWDADSILEFGYKVNQHMIKVPEKLFGYEVPFASDTDIGFTWGDLVGLKFDTETVEWEEFDPTTKKKTEKSRPFREWLEEEKEKHIKKYEKEWYTSLESI